MQPNPASSNRPEQFPPMTALTSMFPIHIGISEPTPAKAAKGPGRNAERAPIRHDPK